MLDQKRESDMAHVEIDDISKRFGATAALSNVSMSVEAGAVHGLLGENGAGKSTLMKVLSGIVVPTISRNGAAGGGVPLGVSAAARRGEG